MRFLSILGQCLEASKKESLFRSAYQPGVECALAECACIVFSTSGEWCESMCVFVCVCEQQAGRNGGRVGLLVLGE